MRASAALMCAALFTFAVYVAAVGARTNWPVVKEVVLTALPTTVYSSSLAAPNGIEMGAGVAVWAAMLSLLKAQRRSTPCYAGLAASAAVLVNAHTLGIAWLFLILAAGGLLVRAQRPWRRRAPRTGRVARRCLPRSAAEKIRGVLGPVSRAKRYLLEPARHSPGTCGSCFPSNCCCGRSKPSAPFPSGTSRLRQPCMPSASFCSGLSDSCCSRSASAGDAPDPDDHVRRRTSYEVPIVLERSLVLHLGLVWQGRYGMPFTAGILLLFGVALEQSGRPLPHAALVPWLAAWIVMHLVSELNVLHVQRGTR